MNRLFLRYPWMCFVLGIVLVANNILRFAPGQAQQGKMAFIVPGICFFVGIMGYVMRRFMPGEN